MMGDKKDQILLIRDHSHGQDLGPWMDSAVSAYSGDAGCPFRITELKVSVPPREVMLDDIATHLKANQYDLVLVSDVLQAIDSIKAQHLGRIVAYAEIVAFDRDRYDGTINLMGLRGSPVENFRARIEKELSARAVA